MLFMHQIALELKTRNVNTGCSGKENYVAGHKECPFIVYSFITTKIWTTWMQYLIKNKRKEGTKERKRNSIQSSTAHLQEAIITANFSCLKNTLGQGKNQRYQFISVTKSVIRLMFVSWYFGKFSPLMFPDKLYESFTFSRSSRSKRKYIVRESSFWNK